MNIDKKLSFRLGIKAPRHPHIHCITLKDIPSEKKNAAFYVQSKD